MLIEGAKHSPRDNPGERIRAGLKHHIATTAPAMMASQSVTRSASAATAPPNRT
ncbi:hypothetical protein JOF53_004764 [Crossiella equi]|uniref:Uncharacterized protein n=1 Tax=Crossiella equi TaxID=130796 RepID=A0ABS5AHY7_9PSEU|nr:hypothetical protein [Crossiella equi]MBP2475892.1 hypothetical protein [Crossiella equi]